MKYLKYILEISIPVFIVVLFVMNCTTSLFWQASLVNILTLFIAFFITYYLKEAKDEKKRLNDIVEKIITEVEQLIRSEDILSDNSTVALTSITACANRIEYLKKYQRKIDIPHFVENINVLDELFTEMRGFYSPNKSERDKHKSRAEKIKELMIARCIDVRLSIFTKI